MGSLWHHLEVFRGAFGCMRVAWGNFGATLKPLWAHFAVTLGGTWFQTTSKINLTCKIGGLEGLKIEENVEKPIGFTIIVWGPAVSGEPFSSTSRGGVWSLWDYFGITLELLGALWGDFGMSLGSLDHCGVTLVPLWCRFGALW